MNRNSIKRTFLSFVFISMTIYGCAVNGAEFEQEPTLADIASTPTTDQPTQSFPTEVILTPDYRDAKVIDIASGDFYNNVLLEDGTVWRIGKDADSGECITRKITNLSDVISISSRFVRNMALTNDGIVYVWYDKDEPESMQNLPFITMISSGANHSLVLDSKGGIWVWGDNEFSQLGNGQITSAEIPMLLDSLPPITEIEAGSYHNLAIDYDGNVWEWGSNFQGESGGETLFQPVSTPQQVPDLENVISIAAAEAISVAITEDGNIWRWGLTNLGTSEISPDSESGTNIPEQIIVIESPVSVVGAGSHFLVLAESGKLWGWGSNEYFPLRVDSQIINEPEIIFENDKILNMSTGRNHTLALLSDNSIIAWGQNTFCQLGSNEIEHFSQEPIVVLPQYN